MSSIIEGYNYDIFISYRQNDNRSGWVKDFVGALQEELAATLKEPISVYFDANPHDGLLETHNVDKSLQDKLKCLIFIPIISQTYCDSKSFAWQYEFCTFNKLSKEDHFGRDIKLTSGNVTSRILPIKIHELDPEDKTLLENELGGILRAIEFIYKESGVNRPLKPADNRNDNQNKTDYRNQVNKIANAIKEIIGGLKNPSFSISITAMKDPSKISKSNTEPFESVAVLPFSNMSSDPEQEYFSDGITEEIINVLAKVPDLKVAGRTSSFAFKGKNEDLRSIGEKLGVKTILEGSVRSSGNRIRITAQLINVQNGFHLWSEKYDREMKDIFEIQDEISLAIVEELKIKLLDEERNHLLKTKTQNLEAYNYYLKGRFCWHKSRTKEGIEEAIRNFKLSVESDPEYALAYSGLANAYTVLADWGYSSPDLTVQIIKEYVTKSREYDKTLAENHTPLIYTYAYFERKWEEAESEGKKALELNPKSPEAHHFYAMFNICLGKFETAIRHNTIARELDPLSTIFNFAFGVILYMSRRFDESLSQLKKTLALDDTFAAAHLWGSFCYLQKGRHDEFIKEYKEYLAKDPDTRNFIPVIDNILIKSGIEGFMTWLVDVGVKLNKSVYNRPYLLAVFHAMERNIEQAIRWLDEACDKRASWTAWLKVDPGLDNLRNDPRFKVQLEKQRLN